jgi:hypothetical protein
MTTPRTRLIAGIIVPDSPLVTDTLAHARRLSDPYLVNHGIRSCLKMKDKVAETCRDLVTARPETSSDNFLRDFGERFVRGYKPVSTVDLLMNAPFAE